MKSLFLIIFTALFLAIGCNVKEPCEINNEGKLCITNSLNANMSVYTNGSKVMDLKPEETKCIDKSAGAYNLNFFSGTEEWTLQNVLVEQCKTTNITTP